MTPRERKRLEEMSRDCPACPECKNPCGSTRDAEGYRRWDNLLTCCACGHGWMASDEDLDQARRADDAHDHLETLADLEEHRQEPARWKQALVASGADGSVVVSKDELERLVYEWASERGIEPTRVLIPRPAFIGVKRAREGCS